LTVDEIAKLSLGRIAGDINRPLDRWHGRCFEVATEIITNYHIEEARLWIMGSDDCSSPQTHHFVVEAPDGRVLDPLYVEVHSGQDLSRSGDGKPFLGTKVQWGRVNGFDCTFGYVHDASSEDPVLKSAFDSLGIPPPCAP